MDRNFILAIALSMLVFLAFDFFVFGPQRQAMQTQSAAEAEAKSLNSQDPDLSLGTPEELGLDRDAAVAKSVARVKIETPELTGSLNLTGARLDDLTLKNFKLTLDEDSPSLVLLNPALSENAFYLQSGIAVNAKAGNRAQWQLTQGDVLTPQSPITLSREEDGVMHDLKISVDDKFMFTYDYQLRNNTDAEIMVKPYALTRLEGFPDPTFIRGDKSKARYNDTFIMHEGPVGVTDGKMFREKFKKFVKKGKELSSAGIGGWVGLTNKNWLAAIIPPQDQSFTASIKNLGTTTAPVFGAQFQMDSQSLPAGQSFSFQSHIYAGTKYVETLRSYEAPADKGGLGIVDFDKATDWGNFFFLTRPIFNLLHFFAVMTGNYGVAILLLVLVLKALLFWFANKGYEMTAKMKKVQPELKALQDRNKDDKAKLQQEMMALYSKHKINPVAGCLPILIQMPIFFSLYKVLFITNELRHEGFLWIKDLSAPDPTSIFNLFGLLPFEPTALPVVGPFASIGILAISMGVAMWVQMKLNPPPTDPIQAQVFGLMPFIFVILFASFPAGLVLYWFWNTFLGVVQQYFIMKRNGVDVNLLENIKHSFQKKKPAANDNK